MDTDVIRVLAEHWDQVLLLLPGDLRDVVAGYAQQLLSSADLEAQLGAARRIVRIVAPRLPADHPVRRALAAESHRYAGPTTDLAPSLALLRASLSAAALDEVIRLKPAAAGDPDRTEDPEKAGDPDREAEDWLLAAPAVDQAEVRRHGVDPESPALIRLGGPGQASRWPTFQFDPAGRPYPVVTEINILLDADHDPWGVADWWLGRNAWLDACPANLVARGEDARLIAAAQAVVQEG